MKILHLLSGGGIGGIEMLCQNIAELNRGENEFCFLYSGGSIAEEMKQSGVPVYLYFREKLVLRMFKLWLLVKRQKYDVIIVHHEGIGIYLFYLMLLYHMPHLNKTAFYATTASTTAAPAARAAITNVLTA